MLPFVTKRDPNQAAQAADVSLEARNLFLNKMLLEQGQPGIRLQLHTLWTEWVDKTNDEQLVPEVAASLGTEAVTPPDDEERASEEETGRGQSAASGAVASPAGAATAPAGP